LKKWLIIGPLLLVAVIVCVAIATADELEKPLYNNITIEDYKNHIKEEDTFFVYIHKTSCPACQQMKPIVNKIINEEDIKWNALNTEEGENFDLSFFKENEINKTPTYIIYKDGEEISRLEGIQSQKDITEFLEEGKIIN
jgi:thioredoxin 1